MAGGGETRTAAAGHHRQSPASVAALQGDGGETSEMVDGSVPSGRDPAGRRTCPTTAGTSHAGRSSGKYPWTSENLICNLHTTQLALFFI